jgi:hypothetical protein
VEEIVHLFTTSAPLEEGQVRLIIHVDALHGLKGENGIVEEKYQYDWD